MGDEPCGRRIRPNCGLLDEPARDPIKSEAKPKPLRAIGLRTPRTTLGAPVGRFKAPFFRRHRAAAGAFVFVGAVLASFLSAAFERFSVPTSVSLSSPRMNASTLLWAMSSWIWTGGLFMK
jgi:hypothetical protein